MQDLLYSYNPWWESSVIVPDAIKRDSFLDLMKEQFNKKPIVILTGLRRVGKTTLMKLFIKHLIEEKKVDSSRILYVSLDDYNLSNHALPDIISEYRKIHKIKIREKIYLFLDEIVYHDNIEIHLKNVHDNQNIKIYASASSASILKSKKPYLTGRTTIIEVLPLDFNEYLKFKKIKISREDNHLVDKYLQDYFQSGGMPEYVLYNDVLYLQNLVDDIIYKDIVGVYKIKNVRILKDFWLLLMERAGKVMSINKMANILDISPNTVKRYLEMFADTFLIYLVERHGKTNERILSPQKIYAADLGIKNFFTGFRDKGSLFENYFFLKIKHLKPYYIYENKHEIDFFLKKESLLVEVKYNSKMNEKQKKLFDSYPAKEKIVIENYKDFNEFEKNKLS